MRTVLPEQYFMGPKQGFIEVVSFEFPVNKKLAKIENSFILEENEVVEENILNLTEGEERNC